MFEARYVAINPANGCHLRNATAEEVAAWEALPLRFPKHPNLREPVRIGDVLIDRYSGPGMWFGGAGF